MAKTREKLEFAKLYNRVTGSRLSHWELEDIGFLEKEKILLAFDLMNSGL